MFSARPRVLKMADSTVPSSSKSANHIVFISRKGGTILLRGGHEYYARKKHKTGLVVWSCTKRNSCKGILRIKDDKILAESAHKCDPDFAKNEIAERIENLKKKLNSPDFPSIPTQYNSMLGNLKDCGLDMISTVPNFSSIKSTLYRHRNSVADVSKMQFKNVLEVEVPNRFQNFLLADYACLADETRIIIFSSEDARQTVCKLTEFYGDGTFKSCPEPFSQLYTIHGDTDSTGVMPLMYALMSNKKTHSYVVLFSLIKSQIPNWNPSKFKTDYEMAAMNAISLVFPSVIVKGCYFHYNKAIYSKGRELKMTKDPKKRRMVGLSAVLPLLPQTEIMRGWKYIFERYNDDDPNTKKFTTYMERQWIREEFTKVWCVCGEKHRTTNSLEAWHGKLNKAIVKKGPNLMHLLHTLKEDSSLQTIRSIQSSSNATSVKNRLKKDLLKDEFIQEMQLELTNGLITVGHLLEILRY